MTFELYILVAATALGLVHLSAASFAFKAQVGNRYTVGPRDEERRPVGIAGRLARAQANFMESYPFFAALVLIVHVVEGTGVFSFWGVSFYIVGRAVYLPLYAAGLPWVRTFSWNFATLGIVLVGVELFI